MIRRAGPEDADAIAALYQRSFATLTFLPVLHTLDELRGWLARRVAECEVWVWQEGESILGFATIDGDELEALYVEPSATGRGIGSALLDHVKSRRPEGFELWTFQQNAGARRFYERHGCVAVELTDGYGNEERTPDVRYEWRPAAPAAPAR